MAFTTFTSKRPLTIEELREVLSLMETQETTDKWVATSLHIDGEHATIDVVVDDEGNVTMTD